MKGKSKDLLQWGYLQMQAEEYMDFCFLCVLTALTFHNFALYVL